MVIGEHSLVACHGVEHPGRNVSGVAILMDQGCVS